jgi:hypothetical protein
LISQQSNSTHSVKEENKTANTEGSFDDEDSNSSGDDLKHSSRSDSRQDIDNAFRDEDDMITLDTQSTLAGLSLHGLQRQADAIFHEADRAEWRLQKTLEQVEESILESRPSDEANSCTSSHSVATSFDARSSPKNDREETLGDDDESTNMVATVVAQDRGITSRNTPQAANGNSYNFSGATNPATSRRPMHVLVDASAPSPSHTILTMDGTMLDDTWMNESMAVLSVLGDDDVSSTMTPILDRYRLDPDDGSLGIKVVPNKRGYHKKKSLRKSRSSFDMQDVRNVLPTVYSGQKEMLSTPMSLPGSVSARKKKNFRKTPHPHKKEVGSVDYAYSEEENGDPNVSQPFYRKPSYESKKEISLASTSVPPLRQRSLELRSSLPVTPQNTRARSMQPQSQPFTPYEPSKSRTSPAALVSIRASANERKVERLQSSQSQARPLTREFHGAGAVHTRKWIEKITMAEYEVAPLAVRQQVSRDEVNEAAVLLDHFLGASISEDQKPLEFTEAQAYEVLRDYLDTAQKTKSVLLSLCHWRRLLMYRDSIHGMSFVVNHFEN